MWFRPRFVVTTGALALFLASSSDALAQSLAAPAAAPTVNVHVESDRPVTLYREGEDDPEGGTRPPWDDGTDDARAYNRPPRKRMRWFPVCESPCDRDMPLDANYRLDGDGIRPTRRFRLVGRPGERVVVVLDPSTTASFATGIAIGGVGIAGVATGAFLLAGAFIDALMGDSHPQLANAGFGCVLGGGIVMLVGGVVFRRARRSSLSIAVPSDPASPVPVAPASPLPTSAPERSVRGVWRDLPQSPQRAAIFSVPIWSTTF